MSGWFVIQNGRIAGDSYEMWAFQLNKSNKMENENKNSRNIYKITRSHSRIWMFFFILVKTWLFCIVFSIFLHSPFFQSILMLKYYEQK